MKRLFAGICLFALCSSTLTAAELKLLPAEVSLTGPNAHQRLLVLAEDKGDRTAEAKFSSSNLKVATVDEAGIVQAVGDGEAVITATHEGKQTTAKVKVSKAKETFVPSFQNDVIPLLTKIGCNSGACHGALAGKGGLKLSLRGYDPEADHFVLTRQALSRRVDRQEPGRSLMLLKPTAAITHGGGQKLHVDSNDYQLLADWIASGAPGPKEKEPHITRLEAFPPNLVLKPKDNLQVVVRAWYSDGRAADVTHWARFSSTEELVAGVNDEGQVAVKGHGETAISVYYSNLVATSRIVSPLENQVDASAFGLEPRKLEDSLPGVTTIDKLVLKKLESLRIPPSSLCNDNEFIRRAFLDATGTLPTPEEVQKFVADTSSDKRAKLIDHLLSRPEFIDYWAYKWSDLLLVSTRKMQQPAMWAFYQFIRQSVADNKPWDRFAREVLTASGSNLQNGAANYFVIHKDVTDLTESTSVTFLGMSITCCRCHNHPLEKWTQDQYWGFANLFSRVALKNGERGGEITVQALPFGDVPHLRRGVPMPPTPLDGKPLALDSTADRRQYLADWLTAPDNPYFAKAIVNRVWRNYLGRGLVEAEDDLRQTNPPTNEELLDALVEDFIAHKYDVKHLMRTIMNSATYQRSSVPVAGNESDDRFYSHYLIRRLSAEVIIDAYSQITGVPTPYSIYFDAKPVFNFPAGTRALQLPDIRVGSTFLDSFGRPERVQTCACERQQDSSVSQALHLFNGQTLNDKLRDKKSLVSRWLEEKISDEDAVRRVFLLGFSREPTASELTKFKGVLEEYAKDPASSRREALEDLFWAVLTGREFLFSR